MSWIAAVGWSAAALLVALWLVVSFMASGRRREIVEWLAATCMYLALLAFFTGLVQDARADESTVRLIAFGLLWIIFAGGLLVSAANSLRALRGLSGSTASATH